VRKSYTPERGDLIFVNLSPNGGHEQKGKRPAVVLSPRSYNQKTGMAIVVPVTSRVKGYPFESPLPENIKVSGVALCDQLRQIDWEFRKAQFLDRVPDGTLKIILAKSRALLE